MVLRALSLCSGVGGLDLALRPWARSVCYVERDAFAAAVLVARMEDSSLDPAPVWSDLRTFDARRWRGAVDLVVGGYPCQPFSAAGNRLGDQDERHLWPDIARILDECGAPLAFFENVAGHLSLGFSDVLGDLAALGFDAEWGVLAASDVGASHKRERLWILAYRDLAGLRKLGRGGLLDGQRAALGDDADGRDAALEDAASLRRGERARAEAQGRSADAGSERAWFIPGGLEGPSRAMGDSERCGHDGRPDVAFGGSLRRTAAQGPSCAVGDADLPRLEGHDAAAESRGTFRNELAAWPPGPSDRAGWERWIAAGGPQPVVRRGADGVPDRLDRLRCLGNAVVPACARGAFRVLATRAGVLT